jgi:hypothetical protein
MGAFYAVQHSTTTVLHVVRDVNGDVSTASLTGFSVTLYDPSNNDDSSLATWSEPVTDGFLDIEVTPNESGNWRLLVTNPSGTDEDTYEYIIQTFAASGGGVASGVATGPKITYTPTDESSSETVNFPHMPFRFQGYPRTTGVTRVSIGGAASSVVYDAYTEYRLEVRSFSPNTDAQFFADISSWWSHAAQGGEFAFALDKDNELDTTISSAAAQGDTTLSVNSTTTLATGDWILLEDADNPEKFDIRNVTAISGSTVTVNSALTYGFASGSTFRHYEYLPACVVTDPGTPPLQEREGGRGNRRYDMLVTFRSVR